MVELGAARLAADAAAFAAALPASVEMPAGTGKTHLLCATAAHAVDSGGRALVLTHTNAGVFAIKGRLKQFGIAKGVQVSTISAFAFRVARAYPALGQLRVPKVMVQAESAAYVEAATRVLAAQHIRAVVAASFTHLLVDEYQDCNEAHHALILALKGAVPATGVLGDPRQAIFGFADKLAPWASVTAAYPELPMTPTPHRWAGHNEELGQWLLDIRDQLTPGNELNWTTQALPTGVSFKNIAGDRMALVQEALSKSYAPTDTVLVLAAWQNAARNIAGTLHGVYTTMEEMAGAFMVQALQELASIDASAYALWLFRLTKSCHCGHGRLDTGTLQKRYEHGRQGADLLLAKGAGSRAGAEPAIHALDTVVANPTLSTLVAAMDVIPTSPGLLLHSHEAWRDIQTAMRGAVARGHDKDVLTEELAKARERMRLVGRRHTKRVISRTLLVKGLEFDHVIIANADDHAEVNDLYVALSRARKTVRILARSDSLRLLASPDGPRSG